MEDNNNQQVSGTNVRPVNPVVETPITTEPVMVSNPITESSNVGANTEPMSEEKKKPVGIIIVIVVILLAVIGVCLWKFVLKKDDNSDSASNIPETNNAEKQDSSTDNTSITTNETISNSPIVGTWGHCFSILDYNEQYEEFNDVEMTYTFNQDGTGKYVAGEMDLNVEYDISGDYLNMSIGGMRRGQYTYSIEGNTLNIKGDAGGWRCTKE